VGKYTAVYAMSHIIGLSGEVTTVSIRFMNGNANDICRKEGVVSLVLPDQSSGMYRRRGFQVVIIYT
jgi:hypothetical protein